MNKKNKGVFFAIIFAILGVVLLALYIKKLEQKYAMEEEVVDILVAKMDIGSRELLSPDKLEIKKIPRSFVQPEALKADTQLLNDIGHPIYATLVPIKKGEQILFTKIASFGKETGLSLTIPEGYRAVSTVVTKDNGVGDLIKPGDYVDIFLLIEYNLISEKRSFGLESKKFKMIPLFQSVYVLAVNDEMTVKKAETGKKEEESRRSLIMQGTTITIALKPEEVPKFLYARAQGKIFFALRPMGDKEIEEIPEIEMKHIVKEERAVSSKSSEETEPSISIIRGLRDQMQRGNIIPFQGQ